MLIQPYMFFDGRCEEALDFYRRRLNAEVTMLLRYKESPDPPQPGMVPAGCGDKIMHSSFRVGDTTVMASDGRCQGQPVFQGFSLALSVADVRRRRTGCSRPSPTAGRCRCRWAGRFSPRASPWWPTASACPGW